MGSVRVKMLKSLAIVTVATIAAVGAAGGVMAVDGALGAPSAVLPAAEDGHYWALGTTDGGELRLLVDTGATRVSLTREDAERLGLILTDDAFTETVATAAGSAMAAPVTLDWLAVGPTRIENVEAFVIREGLGHSLLGMSYLNRLDAFGVEGGAMRLDG